MVGGMPIWREETITRLSNRESSDAIGNAL